jgi:hypothetical protein
LVAPICVTFQVSGCDSPPLTRYLAPAQLTLPALHGFIPDAIANAFPFPVYIPAQRCTLHRREMDSASHQALYPEVTPASLALHSHSDFGLFVHAPLSALALCKADLGGLERHFFGLLPLAFDAELSRACRALFDADDSVEWSGACQDATVRITAKRATVFRIGETQHCVWGSRPDYLKCLQRESLLQGRPKGKDLRVVLTGNELREVNKMQRVRFRLPTQHEFVAFIPKDHTADDRRQFVESYLEARFRYTDGFSLGATEPFEIALTPVKVPSRTPGWLVFQEGEKAIAWRWAPETPWETVKREAASLLQLDIAHFELSFAMPAQQIGGAFEHVGQIVPFVTGRLIFTQFAPPWKGIVQFEGFPVSVVLKENDRAVTMRYAVVSELKQSHSFEIDPADLIISTRPESDADIIADGVPLANVPRQLFSWRRSTIEIHFSNEADPQFTRRFPRTVNIADVRSDLATYFQQSVNAIHLFFAGRELPDELMVEGLRLDPSDILIITLDDEDLSQLDSSYPRDTVRCTFKIRDGEQFEIEMLAADSIDRVRLLVAERHQVRPEFIIIFHHSHVLQDATVLSSLGPNPLFEVSVVTPDVARRAAQQFVSLRSSFRIHSMELTLPDCEMESPLVDEPCSRELPDRSSPSADMQFFISQNDLPVIQGLWRLYGQEQVNTALQMTGGDLCCAQSILKGDKRV